MKKKNIIFAEAADTLYDSNGVVANMEEKEWLRFHNRNLSNYLLTASMVNPIDKFTNYHHYYAIRGCIIHIAVQVQNSASMGEEIKQ